MSYENPVSALYRFPAASLASAAVVGRIMPPKGMRGVLNAASAVVTTGVTDDDATVEFGIAGETDAFGTLTVPVSTATSGSNELVPVSGHEIPADTMILITANGEATAGAADLLVHIDWY